VQLALSYSEVTAFAPRGVPTVRAHERVAAAALRRGGPRLQHAEARPCSRIECRRGLAQASMSAASDNDWGFMMAPVEGDELIGMVSDNGECSIRAVVATGLVKGAAKMQKTVRR